MVVIMMHSISFSFSLFSVFFRKDLYRFLLIYERDLRLNSACRREKELLWRIDGLTMNYEYSFYHYCYGVVYPLE